MPRNWTLWNDAIEKQPTQSSFKFERPGECKRRTWVQPQKAMWQRVWFLLQESNSWLTATLHLSKPNDKPYLEEKTLRMHETCFSSDLIYTNTVRCVVTISPNQLSHQAEIFCHYLFSINVASHADILRNPAQIQSATSACKQVASKTLSQVWLVKLVKSWQILSSALGLHRDHVGSIDLKRLHIPSPLPTLSDFKHCSVFKCFPFRQGDGLATAISGQGPLHVSEPFWTQSAYPRLALAVPNVS